VVYRIHFTMQYLARTRVVDAPMPLIELGLATRVLQDRSQPVRLDAWRREARGRLTAQARMTLSLIPPVGWSPTFLGVAQTGPVDEVLERARATPRQAIAAELTRMAARQRLPSWARRIPDDADLRNRLFDGLADLNNALLAPVWAQVTDLFTVDRTLRIRHFISGGVDHLLAQANPQWIRWKAPILEIRMINGLDIDLHLQGQGILLVPSAFCTRTVVDDGASPQPIVTYPAGLGQPLFRTTTATPRAVGSKPSRTVSALLGRTRTTVLITIAEHPGCSTKELAALAGIAPASASEHATILREAGLIKTGRHRSSVIHSPTDLGVGLLNR
jgi:MarR family